MRADEISVGDSNGFKRHTAALRCDGKENAPRISARMANGAAGILHGKTARGYRLIRAIGRDHADDADAFQRYIQFIGGNLRKCGQNALAKFHLAGLHFHKTISAEMQPL